MYKHPRLETVTEHVVNGEIPDHLFDIIAEYERGPVQCLGIDGDGFVVFYSVDDGCVIYFQCHESEHQLVKQKREHIGKRLDPDDRHRDEFAAAYLHVSNRTHDTWTWTHPRFRWVRDAFSSLRGDD